MASGSGEWLVASGEQGSGSGEWLVRVTPPRVFCKKSLDLLDNKGVEFSDGAKEFVIDRCGKVYDFFGAGISGC